LAAPLYSDVASAVRANLDDQGIAGGAVYTDAFLQRYIEMGQQTLVNALISQSVYRMQFRTEVPIRVPAFTKLLTTLDDPTAASGLSAAALLPPDIVTPDQLWEAKASNSVIANANLFTFTPWSNDGTVTPTVTASQPDPYGGTSATRWAYAGGAAQRARLTTTAALEIGDYNTVAIWLQLVTPGTSAQVTVKSPLSSANDQTITITTGWQRFDIPFGPYTQQSPVFQQIWLDFGSTAVTVNLWDAELGTDQGSNPDFIPMTGPGEIPRIPQSDSLRYWDWYGGRLTLLGSTVDRLLRMTYWATLGPVDPTAKLLIVNSGNAIACLASSFAARAKGQYNAAQLFATFDPGGGIGGQAGCEIANIVNAEVKVGQSEPVRRRPYFGRDRYSIDDYWVRRKN
jgi:hypothetical protein